ncbi:copper amine oxidase N-terminal domain-containing protein [Paenibacillus methanolicus]|uniref:G-D-glutamyl-meso-diaminopimelate peptidase n=1 Tax=Paenibacillus methanolicus TaxID=582686 RepID=A0A5S5C913_9BACL|nr:copper amine oxidase N-terminal domain-containing protein [Paenibacillus methanolicus]TYP74473.1 g-D-glutamyl-meso-diaminopimelate peptidase [Paenibacillus methanolicus]
MPIRVSRPIEIQVDGRAVEVAASALSVNGTTLVPIRVAEALGAQVSWQSETHTVKLIKDGRTILLDAEQGTATIDGAKVPLPAKPLVAAESVLIPLRFVSEAFGAKVDWNAETYTVEIVLASR